MKALWKGQVIAESDQTILVEGNHYFPPHTIDKKYFRPSVTHTVCHWKGLASYFDLVVDDQVNRDASWYYPDPSEAAKEIKDYVAFWKGVEVK